MRAADDTLTQSLEAAESNYARVKLVASHLSSGGQLALTHGSDVAAQNRIIAILRNPSDELQRIRLYVTESLRRLYNQRNLIAHSGSFRSAALSATSQPCEARSSTARTSVRQEASPGSRPMTLTRRRVSPKVRSMRLVCRILRQCSRGTSGGR